MASSTGELVRELVHQWIGLFTDTVHLISASMGVVLVMRWYCIWRIMNMEDQQDDTGSSEQRSPITAWWPSDISEKIGSISLNSKDENMSNKELNDKEKYDRLSYKRASQILWSTGMLSERIPNGFYSVVPVSSKTNLTSSCHIMPVFNFCISRLST